MKTNELKNLVEGILMGDCSEDPELVSHLKGRVDSELSNKMDNEIRNMSTSGPWDLEEYPVSDLKPRKRKDGENDDDQCYRFNRRTRMREMPEGGQLLMDSTMTERPWKAVDLPKGCERGHPGNLLRETYQVPV